jgi:hypothetical protein
VKLSWGPPEQSFLRAPDKVREAAVGLRTHTASRREVQRSSGDGGLVKTKRTPRRLLSLSLSLSDSIGSERGRRCASVSEDGLMKVSGRMEIFQGMLVVLGMPRLFTMSRL